MLLVREISGPANAGVGEALVYTATRFNQSQPDPAELAAVNWVVKQGDTEVGRGQGPSFSFIPGAELAGSAILVMAYRNSPSPNVSATTFIRAAPGADSFREQLREIGDRYPDLLTAPPESKSLGDLVSDATALRYDLEDLVESLGSIPGEAGEEPPAAGVEAADRPRLAIVVGHTARRPGAHAGPPIAQQEYHWNRDLAEMIRTAATHKGLATQICLRDSVGIAGAYAAAEAFQPDAIIELHFNSFSNPAARGAETLYADLNPDSQRLATLVQEHMMEAFGQGLPDRGVKRIDAGGRGYRNLSAAPGVPTVLVEPFFGSNSDDCQLVATSKTAYAEGLVSATLAFLG